MTAATAAAAAFANAAAAAAFANAAAHDHRFRPDAVFFTVACSGTM